MPHQLNLTLKLKQDPASKQKLAAIKANFAHDVQPVIDQAMRESEIVHFARVLIIDDQYIQVLTEYDGDKREYTEFFREKLTPIFDAIFDLAEGSPGVNDPDLFYEFSRQRNIHALGTNGVDEDGYLFSAYAQDKTVKQVKAALQSAVPV